MNIRRLKSSEAETAVRMSEFSFQYQMSANELRARLAEMNPRETWVAEENGEILSKAAVLPLSVYLQGIPVPAGGVSGVATWPEQRRKGLAAKLIKHSLVHMKKNGQLLSLLFPFSVSFYRKFGWELYADQEKITLSKEQFPLHETHEGECRRIKQDASLIGPVYDEWASKRNGTVIRTAEWWKKSVFKRKKGIVAAYYRDNAVKGYLIYGVKERHMEIEEIIWADPDARKGLLSYIRNHDSMADTVSIQTAAHEIFPFLLPDPKAKREVSSYFMARIVDCESLLKMYPFQLDKSQSIIMKVSDRTCEWNEGTYILSASPSDSTLVRFYPPQEEETAIARQLPKRRLIIDITCLTAIIMGAQSAVRLWEEGCIFGDEESVRILDASIPRRTPFIYDFF